MRIIELSLPIYYTIPGKTYKRDVRYRTDTKLHKKGEIKHNIGDVTKDKTFLVGMTWYRNAHHLLQNEVKQWYNEIVLEQLCPYLISKDSETKIKKYKLHYNLFYKNASSDLPNVHAVITKFLNDALKEHGVITDDNVEYLISDYSDVGGKDEYDPRMLCMITEIEE